MMYCLLLNNVFFFIVLVYSLFDSSSGQRACIYYNITTQPPAVQILCITLNVMEPSPPFGFALRTPVSNRLSQFCEQEIKTWDEAKSWLLYWKIVPVVRGWNRLYNNLRNVLFCIVGHIYVTGVDCVIIIGDLNVLKRCMVGLRILTDWDSCSYVDGLCSYKFHTWVLLVGTT